VKTGKKILQNPWGEYSEIKNGLKTAQNLVSALEQQARRIQHILVDPPFPQAAGYLKSAVGHYSLNESCRLVADAIKWGVQKQIEELAVSLKGHEYPDDIDVDSLLARLHEASLQVEMLYGRIGRTESLAIAVERKLCDLAALEA
jgi:hypothetical protein